MRTSSLRRRLAAATTIGAAALMATVGISGVASAATPSDPAGGATPAYPLFYNGNVSGIRDSGSDTTFFVMQKLGDLYTGAGLYGCTLNSAAGQTVFNWSAPLTAVANQQSTCQGSWLQENVVFTSGQATITLGAGGNFPAITAGTAIQAPATYLAAGTTVLSGGGTSTLTLSSSALASSTGTPTAETQVGIQTGVSANVPTTDTADNWDRTEVTQGVDDVGSGAGQNQLCGSVNSPLPVDFSRSSKPAGSCATGYTGVLVGTGYAKDAVPAVDFPNVNPSTFGATASTSPYAAVNGGNIGPVAKGWLPGDPVGGPYSGTAFANVYNNDNSSSSTNPTSTAYRLWCASGAGSSPSVSQITDWGELTNLGPNLQVVDVTENSSTTVTLSGSDPQTTFPSVVAGTTVTGPNIPTGTTVVSGAGTNTLVLSNAATGSSTTATLTFAIGSANKLSVGSGVPIGLPVRIVGVNASSGTTYTFAGFAQSGVTGGNCGSTANANAANDPNPATAPTPNAAHIALENNASNISDFAASDFPGDTASQAVEVATSLYFESNGVYNSVPYAASVNFTYNGTTSQYSATKVTENLTSTTTPNILQNAYPTARTLFNIYNSQSVRASTAGFLNWICDSQSAITKGKDNSTGLNFDAEVNSDITSFGFTRLDDLSTAPNTATPADGIGAPNTTCASAAPGGNGNGEPPVTSVTNPQS